MGNTWKMIDLTKEGAEGQLVCYVGVYALLWRQEWGEPTVGFVQIDEEPTASEESPQ